MHSFKLAEQRSDSLIDCFLNYFSVILANTPELLQEVYRLRYAVYCLEFDHEPRENFPDGMESDEYDPYAMHVLVKHNESGEFAGTSRLVLANQGKTDIQLPLEKYCSESLNQDYLDELDLPRHFICEASRLCVHRNFRRRAGDSKSGSGFTDSFSLNEKRTFPLIATSISLATTALTELTCHPYMFAMMEPFLPRLLHRIGYNFIQVGAIIDYHGKRAAYYVETNSVLENLKPEIKTLYEAIHKSLSVLVIPPA